MFPFNKGPGFFIHSFQMLKWAGDGGGGGFGTAFTYCESEIHCKTLDTYIFECFKIYAFLTDYAGSARHLYIICKLVSFFTSECHISYIRFVQIY